MTFISLSSAPIIALGMQVMLIAWDRTLRIFAYRWYVLVITVGFRCSSVIQLGFENGIVDLVIENLLFDARPGGGGPTSSSTAAPRSCAIRSSASASTNGCGPGGASRRSTTSG